MSNNDKIRTSVFVPGKKKPNIDKFIGEIKEAGIRNMSFSKMALIGSDLIIAIYNGLSDEEKENIDDIFDFVEIMHSKIEK